MTIMLIDDDEDDRLFFSEVSRKYDNTINIVAAANAREALIYLDNIVNALPDYIFLDLRMPGLSGEQCLIEIKKNPRLASIPVIIYTTSKDERESVRLKELGAAHFMNKPVLSEDLYHIISFVFSEKRN